MMAIYSEEKSEDGRPSLSQDVDTYPDACSTKSIETTESRTSSRKSSDTLLEVSANSKSEKSDDQHDSYDVVYKATTEPVNYKNLSSWRQSCCCCCHYVGSLWRDFKSSFAHFSHRDCRILVILCLGTLATSLSVCLFPPFYPKLAEEKGETSTMYGLVIGTNCLTAFIVTPFIGKNMKKIGVNFAFLWGMFSSGVCCILSGLLEYFPRGIEFEFTSYFIRILHATANALVITSTVAFIAGEFPDSVAFLFSLTRATMNLAQMVGPTLGGALHTLGGFKMPFFVLGSFQVLTTIVCSVFLPPFAGKLKDEKYQQKGTWSILKILGVWVSFLTFFFSTMSNGFLSITLEPKVLRTFNISPFYVGLLFGLKDGANCLASPFWGWMCEKVTRVKFLIIFGSVLASLSFILLGPFPGLPIEHTLPITIVALILNGFGVGGQQVAGVINAMKDTVASGFPDEPDTHAFVAGLWSSLSGAGRFISRALSGILVRTIGFQYTSVIVTSLHIFILLATLCYVCLMEDKANKSASQKNKSYSINVETNSPSEPVASKSATVSIPIVREDLEGSFLIGSSSSRKGKRDSFGY